jgi:hypothetical protein
LEREGGRGGVEMPIALKYRGYMIDCSGRSGKPDAGWFPKVRQCRLFPHFMHEEITAFSLFFKGVALGSGIFYL